MRSTRTELQTYLMATAQNLNEDPHVNVTDTIKSTLTPTEQIDTAAFQLQNVWKLNKNIHHASLFEVGRVFTRHTHLTHELIENMFAH